MEQRAKLRIIVRQEVVTCDFVAVDESMGPRDADVVGDANVAVLPSPYLEELFTAVALGELHGVYYIEDLFLFVLGETFEDDKVLWRLLNADNINYLILEGYLEG